MRELSRREFTALVATGALVGRMASPQARAPVAPVTAGEIVERIKKNIGVEWRSQTVDALKAGDPATIVTGIVTTSMATLDVLQQAVKAGANFVITAQPTFYSRSDARTPSAGRGGAGRAGAAGAPPAPPPPPPADPVFTGKNDFINTHNLVVFRLSDHWKMRTPDPIGQGLGRSLGWTKYQVGADSLRYDIPSTTLEALASHVKTSLAIRAGLRVVGDRRLKVQHVGLLPGTTPIQASLALLPAVDVVIAGEVREWETATYVQDVVYAGGLKGFMTTGRVVNEEPGMGVCADWLKTVVPEMPVRHISAGDPYWRPL